LWEAGPAGRVVGWSLLSPHFHAFDVFVVPELLGTPAAEQIWAWTERAAAERFGPGARLSTTWVGEGDDWLRAHLAARGFGLATDHYLRLGSGLAAGSLPAVALPAGYCARRVNAASDAELAARAEAGRLAFESRLSAEAYLARYRAFAASPAYARALDLAVVAPDGAVAAFAIAWPDPATGVGLLEPVGTHPAYQRRGLGRAVVAHAQHALAEAGMAAATVCVESSNPAAQALYLSAGFVPEAKALGYEKRDEG
jgi:ribosomal protein S18 acetylase RimI-like enzyme